jgi:UDP-GlcNAc:undecaprenyl-phosphate GlcNAc-1-phosphate transferase
MDHPGRRKVHFHSKPLVGGVGMVMGLSLACLMWIPLTGLRGFYAGVVLLVTIGFLDDYRETHHRIKLLAQIIASSVMMYYSRTYLVSFGDLLSIGDIDFASLAIPATVFSTVGVINSLNMVDGLDGLAGGISLVAFASFAVLAGINGLDQLVLLSIAFCGVLMAFLRYNLNPAKLFMGDAGSMALGFALAFFSISITQIEGSLVPPVAVLLVLTVPIVDTLIISARRVSGGRSPFQADRYHLHHILLRFGFSEKRAVAIIVAITACFSLVAIAGTLLGVPEYYMFLVFVVYFTVCIMVSLYLKRVFRAFKRTNPATDTCRTNHK